MKTILVTGGAGFVGSLEHGHERAVKWGPLERGDLRNKKDLRRVFEAHRPWAVMHFAAYAYVGESTVDPAKYYDNNVGGTAKLLQACAAFGCENIVFSSSCATYGVPERLPLTEDAPQNPVNPYGYTKLVVERMLKDAEAAYGIRHVALRYFNAAGADPDGELGELHLPETHLIPLVRFAAMGRQPSVKILGHDYPTPDGTCIRDYVHVSDLADTHVAAVDWLAEGKPSEPFNLGNGRGFSVAEVVKTSEKVTGRPVNRGVIRFEADAAGIAALKADAEPKGALAIPVMAIHSINDPQVSVNAEAFYRDLAKATGTANKLVQAYTDENEHTAQSDAEIAAALDNLIQWIESGTHPSPQSVAAECEKLRVDLTGPCRYRPDFEPKGYATTGAR